MSNTAKQKTYYNGDGVSTKKTKCYLETSPNNVQVFYSYSTPMALEPAICNRQMSVQF